MSVGVRKPINIVTIGLGDVAAAKVLWSVPFFIQQVWLVEIARMDALYPYVRGLDDARTVLEHLGIGIAALVLIEIVDGIRWRLSPDLQADASRYVLPSLWRAYQAYRI